MWIAGRVLGAVIMALRLRQTPGGGIRPTRSSPLGIGRRGARVARYRCTYPCVLLILACWNAAGSTGDLQNPQFERAKATLSAAFAAEVKEDYPAFYAFFSKRAKSMLQREEGVRTPEDYRNLRVSGEARWLKHELLSLKPLKNGKYAAVSRATVEETGETDRFCVRYVLVLEEGNWKINDWNYMKACPSVAPPKLKTAPKAAPPTT